MFNFQYSMNTSSANLTAGLASPKLRKGAAAGSQIHKSSILIT